MRIWVQSTNIVRMKSRKIYTAMNHTSCMKMEYEEFDNVGDLFLYLVSAAHEISARIVQGFV